ncbi:MAG TPA: SDR family oxidoreductase [Methylomirabilota bacterium]|nr:SDR family oxidoreductase [Methylomirabilota bacterium]
MFGAGVLVSIPSVRVLIVGCGYVGLPLGRELARVGHDVSGIRLHADGSGELRRAGINPIVADITSPQCFEALRGHFDWVINTLSSNKGGADEYRAVYFEGTARLVKWLSTQAVTRYVYTSSTSVYAQTDGSVVTEESPTEPESETSRMLIKTEDLLRAATRDDKFPAVILRVAGIYGPERGHLFQEFLRGEARMAGDGSRWLNMIHCDDVVRAIIAALELGEPGEIYNVADDEPVTQREFFSWLSDRLPMPIPPITGETESRPRKRTVTNKRISNRKLRLALGCELKYPTFRQGYSAEIARLQAAGQLPVGAGQ